MKLTKVKICPPITFIKPTSYLAFLWHLITTEVWKIIQMNITWNIFGDFKYTVN